MGSNYYSKYSMYIKTCYCHSNCYYSHFTDKETEKEINEIICQITQLVSSRTNTPTAHVSVEQILEEGLLNHEGTCRPRLGTCINNIRTVIQSCSCFKMFSCINYTCMTNTNVRAKYILKGWNWIWIPLLCFPL